MIWIGLKKKEIKKIRPIKQMWYEWLINYIPKPIRKSIGGFEDKIISQTHLNKLYMREERN